MQAEKANPSQTLAEIFAELKQEGKEEGREEGKEEGREEGKEEGMKEGMKKGRKGILQRVVWNSFREGYSDEAVVRLTELELDEVKEMRKEFQGGQK